MVEPISSYDWISVGQYLRWIELKLGLSELVVSRFWSMKVTTNVKSLLGKKVKQEAVIRDNIASLEQYIDNDALEASEVTFCQTMISNHRFYLALVEGQIETLEGLAKWEASELMYLPYEIPKDEIPF